MRPDYQTVSEQITTPAYVFDIDEMKSRIRRTRELLGPRVHLCYAMKANAFVIGAIQDVIDRFEVCSPGEQKICERAGIDMGKVVLSGVYKAPADIAYVVSAYGDTITYTVESLQQLYLLNEQAIAAQTRLRVLLRVTSGNQFGLDEALLRQIIAERERYPGVEIIGLQHFSGTQRRRLSRYEEELRYVDDLIASLEADHGYVAKELEFGPGFYVEYFQQAKPYDDEALLTGFRQLLDSLHFQGTITLELGRYLSATCGTYYTKIVDQKKNGGTDFCIVDGGIHQLNYFGQMMAMKIPYYRHLSSQKRQGMPHPVNICGSLCTVNDNLVKNLPLRCVEIGDILEFSNVGAYSMIEGAALFLSRDLPKIYLYDDGNGLHLMRDRFETNALNYE